MDSYKGESLRVRTSEAFLLNRSGVLPDHRSQWFAIREGSYMAKTRITLL